MKNAEPVGLFLPPGTKVRLDGSDEFGPEYGIVVHCWLDEELEGYDCHVAFYGDSFPDGPPTQLPYVLHYFSTSLRVVP